MIRIRMVNILLLLALCITFSPGWAQSTDRSSNLSPTRPDSAFENPAQSQTVMIPREVSSAPEHKGAADIVTAVAWPLTLLVVFLYLGTFGRSRSLLGKLLGRIRKVSGPAGISLEIDQEEAGRQKAYFQESFEELSDSAKSQYDQLANALDIRALLKKVVETSLTDVLRSQISGGAKPPPQLRATIHVPDIVFEHFLYQLVDYFPVADGRRGRRFSMRYGIIGRAWRMSSSLGEGMALDPPDSHATDEDKQKWEVVKEKLINEWGMFPEEAARGSHGRPSYLCVILRSKTDQGLLFIDSKTQNAFGTKAQADAVAKALENDPNCVNLATAVAEIMKTLRLKGPQLKVDQE